MYLRHVHVIDKVDKVLCTRRTVVSSSLLFKRLFHDVLQYLRRRIKVERNVGDHVVVLRQTTHSVMDENRLASPGGADQHDWTLALQQHIDEVAKACRLCSVYERRLHM